jgi:hypothetical protein
MANLTKKQIKVLNELGIVSTDLETSTAAILKELEKFGIEDMDSEPLDDLVTILQAFREIDENEETVKAEETVKEVSKTEPEEIETDFEAEEETPKPKKSAKKKTAKVVEVITEEEEALLEVEESDVVEETPKKPAKKKAVRGANEKVIKELADEAIEEIDSNLKVAAKVSAKTKKEPKVAKSTIEHYSGNNPDHVKVLTPYFQEIIDSGKYLVSFQPTSINIRLNGSVSARTIITFVDIRFIDGRVRANIHFKSLNLCKSLEDIHAVFLGMFGSDDFIDTLSTRTTKVLYPHFKNVFFENFGEFVKLEYLEILSQKILRLDSKLESNRKKIIESVEQNNNI